MPTDDNQNTPEQPDDAAANQPADQQADSLPADQTTTDQPAQADSTVANGQPSENAGQGGSDQPPSEPTTGKPNDNCENEINAWGIFFAGVLLIFFVLAPLYLIIGLWPDRMPDAKTTDPIAYQLNLFHVKLLVGKELTGVKGVMSLNTLLLILVALSGFLGNMVHVASSFISFVGDKKFRKSWLLWYFVKPFTAAGLAITVYFALRAGLLNSSNTSSDVNLYGVMITSILTGLFTDNATLKMKEVFQTLFKADDTRSGRLDGDPSDCNTGTTQNTTGATDTTNTSTAS